MHLLPTTVRNNWQDVGNLLAIIQWGQEATDLYSLVCSKLFITHNFECHVCSVRWSGPSHHTKFADERSDSPGTKDDMNKLNLTEKLFEYRDKSPVRQHRIPNNRSKSWVPTKLCLDTCFHASLSSVQYSEMTSPIMYHHLCSVDKGRTQNVITKYRKK